MIRQFLLAVAVQIFIVLSAGAVEVESPSENPNQKIGAFTRDGFLVGHNVTATSDMLEGKTCSFGLQVFACRILPRTVLGTSTWMLSGYQMYTAALRHLFSEDEAGNRWAGQISYFQTFREPPSGNYEMKAIWFQGIRTLQIRDSYRLHLNAHLNYYFNDRRPFFSAPTLDGQYASSGEPDVSASGGTF